MKEYTPFQMAIAQQLDANVKAVPKLEKIAGSTRNNRVVWQGNDGEPRLMETDKDTLRMIKGGISGLWNELTFPYETDPVTGAVERVYSEDGHETAQDIVQGVIYEKK